MRDLVPKTHLYVTAVADVQGQNWRLVWGRPGRTLMRAVTNETGTTPVRFRSRQSAIRYALGPHIGIRPTYWPDCTLPAPDTTKAKG